MSPAFDLQAKHRSVHRERSLIIGAVRTENKGEGAGSSPRFRGYPFVLKPLDVAPTNVSSYPPRATILAPAKVFTRNEEALKVGHPDASLVPQEKTPPVRDSNLDIMDTIKSIVKTGAKPVIVQHHSGITEQPSGATKKHCHFSPLEKLNDDCLLLIFQEVRPQITFIANTSPREVRSCNIALLELRRVCKSWKELVESRPELWSTIFVFTRSLRSINSALVYLHRSRQTPLYLYVFGGLSDTPSDETGIAKNFKRGLQVAATRVIHLKLFDPDSELMGIWTAAPRLQELIIFGVVDTTTCFRGDTSNLELMVAPLSTFSTLRSNSTLQKLTNLTIYQSNGRYTARHLAGILGCTPQLRILKLKNMAIESTPSETTHTVSLPLLERLELFGCDRKVAELTELPLQSSISVSFPEFLNDCLVPGFVERVGVTYLPLSFLKSTTLSINVFAGENGRTNVKLNGHWAADGFHSNIHIQLGRGSQLTTRFASCLLACGIVRNLRSVVNLNIHVSIARLPMRLTQWLAGPPNLQNLKITGKYMSQVVRDLLHLDSGSLQSLQSIILERNISTPVVEALEGWLASREQMGVPVQRFYSHKC